MQKIARVLDKRIYFELAVSYEQRINTLDQSHGEPQSTINTHSLVIYRNNSESNIRLPKVELPVFLGLYKDWFHDSFDKLIHANSSLSSIPKCALH